MSRSLLTPHHRALERFARIATAARHCARTDLEGAQVMILCEAVKAGSVNVRDGHATLVALRAQQRRGLGEMVKPEDKASISEWGHAG